MFTNLSNTPETPQADEQSEPPPHLRPQNRWRRRIGRVGCAILLIPWFALMLTPCLVLTLAFQREITLTHSDLPHHAFRVWLIQERDAQGLAVVTSRRVEITTPEPLACVVYDVRFFLWGGDAEKRAQSLSIAASVSLAANQHGVPV